MLKFTLAAAALFICSSALAQTQAAAPAPQQPQQTGGIFFDDSPPPPPVNPKAKANGRLICQDITDTGSRLTKQRICMTADQWKDQVQRDRDLLADTQRNTTAVGANH
jgi:hypothetical protein